LLRPARPPLRSLAAEVMLRRGAEQTPM